MAILVCPLSRVPQVIESRKPDRIVSLLDPRTTSVMRSMAKSRPRLSRNVSSAFVSAGRCSASCIISVTSAWATANLNPAASNDLISVLTTSSGFRLEIKGEIAVPHQGAGPDFALVLHRRAADGEKEEGRHLLAHARAAGGGDGDGPGDL